MHRIIIPPYFPNFFISENWNYKPFLESYVCLIGNCNDYIKLAIGYGALLFCFWSYP